MIILEGPGADEAAAHRLAHQLQYDFQEIDLSHGAIAWALSTHPRVVYYGSSLFTPDPHDRAILSMMLLARGAYRAWSPADATIDVIDFIPTMASFPPEERELADYRRARDLADAYRGAFPDLPGIGNLRPTYALIGETPNPRSLAESYAVPFSVGPAGRWLTSAMYPLRLVDKSYITNAVKHDGDRRTVREELRWLRPKLVIALGKVASSVLSEGGIIHHTIAHPQYARRFQHSQSYANVIKEVMEYGDLS